MGFGQQGDWLDEPPGSANFSDYEGPLRPGGRSVGPVDTLQLLCWGASGSLAVFAIDLRRRQRNSARQAARGPPTKIFDADRGMPLYWQERKPVDLWEDLLASIDAKMVVDLSPGSGAAGRAAMRLGISYVAACREESHASWLSNIFDREACELIVKAKSPLFEQNLASLIKTHFAEVLAQLDQQKKATDASDDDGQ